MEKVEKVSSAPRLTCTKLTILTIAAVIVQIIGLLVFLMAFFPVKSTPSGVSGLESFYPPGSDSFQDYNVTAFSLDQLKSLYQNLSGVPPIFDRLVLMVIDGLPAEFVLGKNGQPPQKVFMEAMPYTQSLLAKGTAIGYHAKAAPPTVTMPRLKAMVSGAIGGFLDVAFNFNTQALLDDNLIAQFLRVGWKMLMFGDDTWLKLFPGMFARHDGVSSFFVKDTVQVDQNVSRHLIAQLNLNDWNLMILHYLGLDHVGHIGGRNSVLMGPKLMEMDEVIKMIDLSAAQSQKEDQGRTLLMIVSDHGMTETGNHGGSTYEETDSLALFVGLEAFGVDSTTNNIANQVDLASTLALLFGVPIPRNSVGILMAEVFKSLTDYEQLRLLELNSWQLLRLLEEHLPNMKCRTFECGGLKDNIGPRTAGNYGSVQEMFCCLYLDAESLHKSWKLEKALRSTGGDDCSNIFLAYYKFLKTASEWLSRKATDRPVGMLAFGVAAMLLSCLVLFCLIFMYACDIGVRKEQIVSNPNCGIWWCHLDESFTVAIVCIFILSMGSSSMVEEEQYIWHFMTSSLYLVLFRKTIQSFRAGSVQNSLILIKGQRSGGLVQVLSIIAVLTSGRILRGWHQGGVNWVYLPDISKWFEQTGSAYTSFLQLVSGMLLVGTSFVVLLQSVGSKRNLVMSIALVYLFPALLVLHNIIEYQDSKSTGYGATLTAQIFYTILSISTMGTAVAVPWLMPLQDSKKSGHCFSSSRDIGLNLRSGALLQEIKDSAFVVGWSYMFSWCLLQLLLQQPINSMPLFLLFIQILATIRYSSNCDLQWVEWPWVNRERPLVVATFPPSENVKFTKGLRKATCLSGFINPSVVIILLCDVKELVAALYFLGMAGHFGLGNTNTLATIDVAGAFMGLSSHSTLLSGILMFAITYASPMLALLSLVMYISVKGIDRNINAKEVNIGDLLKMILGFPCLLPLGVNSLLLTAYTIVLLLMRNHLFIWSVFSPKYLYVCATTACVCIGVSHVASTTVYIVLVLASRRV